MEKLESSQNQPHYQISLTIKISLTTSMLTIDFLFSLGLLLESTESIQKEQAAYREKDLDFQGKQDFWNVARAGAL